MEIIWSKSIKTMNQVCIGLGLNERNSFKINFKSKVISRTFIVQNYLLKITLYNKVPFDNIS